MLIAAKAQELRLHALLHSLCSLCEMFDSGTVLIVEDNPETRSWLESCVASAFPELEKISVGTFAEASKAIMLQSFELALLDLGLPDGNGLDLIQLLCQQNGDCHVIVATIYDDDANLLTALRSGARGYILKDQDLEKIVGYLQGIKAKQPALSAASSQRLIDHFNSKGSMLQQHQLTPRELDVTCLVAKGYSIEEAAQMLTLAPETVKGYVKTIYSKLGVGNRSELTLAAVNLGLIES